MDEGLQELYAESEAMAEVTPPPMIRVTGSTGTNPLTDGTLRAMILGVPAAAVAFSNFQWQWITNADALTALLLVVAPAGPILWGVFDRFIKPRLASS